MPKKGKGKKAAKRSFIQEIHWKLINNFPVRSSVVIVVVMAFCAIGVCLLSVYLLVMSHLKESPYSPLNAKFKIQNFTYGGKQLNTTFFNEFKIFNVALTTLGQYGRNRITVCLAVCLAVVLIGVVTVIFRCVILFILVLILLLACGSIFIWFGYSIITSDLTILKSLFSDLLVKYNASYVCMYDDASFAKCYYDTEKKMANYSGQLAAAFNKWMCCGYTKWEELSGPPSLITLPYFCCPNTDTKGKKVCAAKDLYPTCEPIVRNLVKTDVFISDYRIITIALGAILLLMFLVALYHLIICSRSTVAKSGKGKKKSPSSRGSSTSSGSKKSRNSSSRSNSSKRGKKSKKGSKKGKKGKKAKKGKGKSKSK